MSPQKRAGAEPETEVGEPELPKYHIDEGWYERQGRSLQHMIEARLAPSEGAEEKPARKRGRAARAPTMEDVAKVEGFVNPQLPLMEAVFRLLLVHQNKPLDLEEISQELAERGIGVTDARAVRPDILERMVDRDTHYGIVRYSE